MPTPTPNEQATVRKRPFETEAYMVMAPYGDPAFIAYVDAGTARGDMTIPFHGGIGDLGDIEPGMTLWVGSTGSTSGLPDLGTVRIRDVATGTFYVAENDDILWGEDVVLIVPGEAGFREIWGVFQRLVEGTPVTFYKDYDRTYVNEGDHLPPKANAGPPCIGFGGPPTGTASTLWIGEDSYAVEDGEAVSDWVWDFADGNPLTSVAQGTRAAPISVDFNTPGFRYVRLQVTDTLGTTGTTYVPVWVDCDFWKVEPLELAITGGSGWKLRVRVYEADASEFVDQSLIAIGYRSWYDGDREEVGGFPHRENLFYAGWLDGETLTFDATVGTVTFDVISTDEILRYIPGFAFSLDEVGSPSDWPEIADLNVDRAQQHLLEFHTTVNQVCHRTQVGEGNLRMVPSPQVFPKGSIHSQVHDALLIDCQCKMVADRQGILRSTMNPQMMDLTDRNGVSVNTAFEESDLLGEVDLPSPHRASLGFIPAGGWQEETPLLSQAPGACPLQQANEFRLGELIVQDQDELNLWSGLKLATANNPYPELSVDLVGFWPFVDPAFQEWVTLTAEDPISRVNFENDRFIPRALAFKFGNRTIETSITLELESWGPPGETVPVPEPPPPDDPYAPPLPIGPPIEPPNLPVRGVVVWTEEEIGRTSNILRHYVVSEATVGSLGVDLFDTAVDFDELEVDVGDDVWGCHTGTSTTIAAVDSANHLTLNADIGIRDGDWYAISSPVWTDIAGGTGPPGEWYIQFIPVKTSATTVGGWLLTDQNLYWASNVLTGTPGWSSKYTLVELRAHHADLGAAEFRGIATYPGDVNYVILSFDVNVADTGFGAVYTTGAGWNYSLFPVGNQCIRTPFFDVFCEPNSGAIYLTRMYVPGNEARMLVSADGGANFGWTVGVAASWIWNNTRYDFHASGGDIQFCLRTNPGDDDSPKHSSDGSAWTSHLIAGYTGDQFKTGITGHFDTGSHILAMFERDADNHYICMRSDSGGGDWFEIGDASYLFEGILGGYAGCTAIVPEVWVSTKETMGWVCLCESGFGGYHDQRRIFYTENYEECWVPMMGNWYTLFGNYEGAGGSSGARGNVGFKFLPRTTGDDE